MDYDDQGRPYDIAPSEWLVHPRAEFDGPVDGGEDLLRIDL